MKQQSDILSLFLLILPSSEQIFSSFLKLLRQLVSDKKAVTSFGYDYSGEVAWEEMNFLEDGLSRLFRRLEDSGMGMNFFKDSQPFLGSLWVYTAN